MQLSEDITTWRHLQNCECIYSNVKLHLKLEVLLLPLAPGSSKSLSSLNPTENYNVGIPQTTWLEGINQQVSQGDTYLMHCGHTPETANSPLKDQSEMCFCGVLKTTDGNLEIKS